MNNTPTEVQKEQKFPISAVKIGHIAMGIKR